MQGGLHVLEVGVAQHSVVGVVRRGTHRMGYNTLIGSGHSSGTGSKASWLEACLPWLPP